MAVSIYLYPPYIAVLETASVYGINLPINQNVLTFGYVEAVNYNSLSAQQGDRILYPINPLNPVVIINTIQYSLIDETKIILKEPIAPPA